MKKFKYQNALTEDLWETLAHVSGKPVADMMTGWTKHTGFPMIRIEEGVRTDSTHITYRATQCRFLAQAPQPNEETVYIAYIYTHTHKHVYISIHMH